MRRLSLFAVVVSLVPIQLMLPAALRADKIGQDPSSPCDAIAGNLVANCGFETGDFRDWTSTPAPTGSFFGVTSVSDFVHSGNFGAYFGALSFEDDSISQVLTTNKGMTYIVAFWLFHNYTDLQNHFEAEWDGIPILNLANVGAFPYTEEVFTVTGTGSDTLDFSSYEGPAYFGLDDVSVTSAPDPIPEPASVLLVGTSLFAFFGTVKRKLFCRPASERSAGRGRCVTRS